MGAVCTIIEIEKEKEKRLKVCTVLEKPVLVTAFIERKEKKEQQETQFALRQRVLLHQYNMPRLRK